MKKKKYTQIYIQSVNIIEKTIAKKSNKYVTTWNNHKWNNNYARFIVLLYNSSRKVPAIAKRKNSYPNCWRNYRWFVEEQKAKKQSRRVVKFVIVYMEKTRYFPKHLIDESIPIWSKKNSEVMKLLSQDYSICYIKFSHTKKCSHPTKSNSKVYNIYFDFSFNYWLRMEFILILYWYQYNIIMKSNR